MDGEWLMILGANLFGLVLILFLIVAGVWGKTGGTQVMEGLRNLSRDPTSGRIGGVCAGLGKHTVLPAWLWRLVFLAFLLFFGNGVLLYVLLWASLPAEPQKDVSH